MTWSIGGVIFFGTPIIVANIFISYYYQTLIIDICLNIIMLNHVLKSVILFVVPMLVMVSVLLKVGLFANEDAEEEVDNVLSALLRSGSGTSSNPIS